MAKQRRPSPTEDDIRRIAETIKNIDTFKRIKDKQTFIEEYKDYMTEENELFDREDIQDRVFKEYAEQYHEAILHEVAEGLPRKRVGLFKRSLRQMGEQDTEQKKIIIEKQKKQKRVLNIIKYTKGKLVYTNYEKVNVRGKEQVRYRNRYGQFAGKRKLE